MNVSLEFISNVTDGRVAVARFHPTGTFGNSYNAVCTLIFKGEDVYVVGLLSSTRFSLEHFNAIGKVLKSEKVKTTYIRRNIDEPFREFKFSEGRLQ